MAKSSSNGTPGSVEAANVDWNPHELTEESGAPDPHSALSACGGIDLEWGAGIRRGR